LIRNSAAILWNIISESQRTVPVPAPVTMPTIGTQRVVGDVVRTGRTEFTNRELHAEFVAQSLILFRRLREKSPDIEHRSRRSGTIRAAGVPLCI